jgi:Ca2+-binding RTX toxin-like protein
MAFRSRFQASTTIRQRRGLGGGRRARVGLLLLAACALLAGLAVSQAGANHIAGATYNGTVQGTTSNISFTVTGDGQGISSMSASGPLPGDICTFSNAGANYVVPLPITNHTFNDSTAPIYFAGSFPGAQSAQGTLRIDQGGCDTGNLNWSATTSSPPPAPAPTARCQGRPATIVGNASSQTLNGTGRRDVIAALGGRDTVRGRGGNDIVCAGAGNDVVNGGAGNDVIRGDAGKDTLKGAGGRDRLLGGGGRDSCIGGAGNDRANCETERTV